KLSDAPVTMPIAAVGGLGAFFSSGTGVWKTDGTPQATALIPGSAAGSSVTGLTASMGRVFYSAYDRDHGSELWTSDGTAAGTMMVRDINPGPEGSYPAGLVDVDGLLYFSADDGVHGIEVWRSAGTSAQTTLWADLNRGPESSLSTRGPELFRLGSRLMAVSPAPNGPRLWRVDRSGASEVTLPFGATPVDA